MVTSSLLPKVSVIIPCYNQAHYLGEAIQSVLNQTYQDFEIIVVDDGSTDNTFQVASSFGAPVLCIQQKNRGLAGARNKGLQHAKGEFIAFLDADDMWFPRYLAIMLLPFSAFPTIGATYCGWQYVDSAGRLLPRKNIRIVPPEKTYSAMVFMDFMIPSGVFVRRECFDHLGLFDENLRTAQGCEDWDMWLRILSQYRMIGVPQALVKYRVHGDNMSANLDQMERAKRAVIFKHFGAEENATEIHRLAYGGLYLNLALAYLERAEMVKGQLFLKRSLQTYPELINDLDTFYQIALASQPVGYRGVFEYLDLDQITQLLFNDLNSVFESMPSQRSSVYGMAYFALGMLAYGKRDLGQARRFLIRAVLSKLSLLLNRKWLLTFLKSLLGIQILTLLKNKRWRHTGTLVDE